VRWSVPPTIKPIAARSSPDSLLYKAWELDGAVPGVCSSIRDASIWASRPAARGHPECDVRVRRLSSRGGPAEVRMELGDDKPARIQSYYSPSANQAEVRQARSRLGAPLLTSDPRPPQAHVRARWPPPVRRSMQRVRRPLARSGSRWPELANRVLPAQSRCWIAFESALRTIPNERPSKKAKQ